MRQEIANCGSKTQMKEIFGQILEQKEKWLRIEEENIELKKDIKELERKNKELEKSNE